MDALSLLRATFDPLGGRRLIDIGCGQGRLAGALAEDGARVTGVDPGTAAIAVARESVPGARFEIASAERLPFADAAFEGAVLLNSLHHVPDPAAALREAARVVGPGRAVVVIEPLAEGSAFAALRPIEDETAIRAGAQAAVDAALAGGALTRTRDAVFERRERVAGLDGFLDRVRAVDPARDAAIRANGPAIAAAFAAAAMREPDGRLVLVQPLRAQVLVAAG